MNTSDPFNANPELVAMRENVASRVLRLRVVEGVINLAAIALVAVALFSTGGAGLMSAGPAVPLMLAAVAGLGSFVTMKARKRLEIDEEFLQSRMQGKNWWGGYRQEVMSHGHGHDHSLQAPFPGMGDPSKGHSRE